MKQRLLELRVKYNLTVDDVSTICGVSNDTVKSWLYRSNYDVPANMVRLLQLELERGKE